MLRAGRWIKDGGGRWELGLSVALLDFDFLLVCWLGLNVPI